MNLKPVSPMRENPIKGPVVLIPKENSGIRSLKIIPCKNNDLIKLFYSGLCHDK